MSQRPRYRSVVADSARWDGFRFRPGDIVISTPPKCGTTWMQRLVALLLFDGEPPGPISSISPWLDMQLATTDDVFALLETQQHRRFIKSHTAFDGLPVPSREGSRPTAGRGVRKATCPGSSTAMPGQLLRMGATRFRTGRPRVTGCRQRNRSTG